MNGKVKYKETIEFNSSTDRNKLSIVKSNKLVEAKYKLTLNEQRLILLMVSMIRPEDNDFKNIRIRIQDLKEILDLQRKDLYEEMPEITKRLMSRILEIEDLEKNKLLQISWISSAEYFFGEGVVELSFDPKLKPYLLKLKEAFTIYNLHSVLRLRSSYAIRFYELLKQYEKIGQRKFSITELKEILGIGKKEYKLYGHFKSRVIIPASKELKEKTDIYFEFEEVKKGRKVVEIIFYIRKNPNFTEIKEQKKIEKLPNKTKNINTELFERIRKYTTLSEDKINEIFNSYDEKLIKKTFDYAINQYKEKKVKNLTAFFLAGLKDNYFKLTPYEEEKIREKQEGEEQKKLASKLENELNDLNKEYRNILRKEILKYFSLFPDNQKEELENEFNSIVDNNIFLKTEYERNGLESKIIQSKFTAFLLPKFQNNLNLPFDNFIDFLNTKKFDFYKLERIKKKYKLEKTIHLEDLLYWYKKLEKLNLPLNILLPYHLDKENLDIIIENKVINYLYENLPSEQKEEVIEKAKNNIDSSLIGEYRKEALKYNIKKIIKEMFSL